MHIRSLHPGFGVEVLAFDFHRPTQGEIDGLRGALDEHQLLLFRNNERIAPEQQVELCSWFGPPVGNRDGDVLWSVLRNEDAAGSIKLPFHADFSYTDSPIKVISLHAIEVPAGGTSTSFVSGICGWATLASDLQELLAPMTLRHKHVSVIAENWPAFIAEHPVRKIHPRSGRPILFVTEHHADRILELDADKSRETLDRIFDHMYREERIYTHRWLLHDLVVWDNFAVQHARREAAMLASGKREVQRVVVNDVAFTDLIERARQQQEQRRQVA